MVHSCSRKRLSLFLAKVLQLLDLHLMIVPTGRVAAVLVVAVLRWVPGAVVLGVAYQGW